MPGRMPLRQSRGIGRILRRAASIMSFTSPIPAVLLRKSAGRCCGIRCAGSDSPDHREKSGKNPCNHMTMRYNKRKCRISAAENEELL